MDAFEVGDVEWKIGVDEFAEDLEAHAAWSGDGVFGVGDQNEKLELAGFSGFAHPFENRDAFGTDCGSEACVFHIATSDKCIGVFYFKTCAHKKT